MVAWCHVQATCWNLLAVLRCLEAIPSRFQKQDLKWYDYFHVFFTRDFQFVKINVFKWLRKKQNLGCIPIPWEKVLGGLPWLARLNLDGIDQRSTSPKSGCFFSVGFFFHFVAMTDQPVLFGAFVSEWKCGEISEKKVPFEHFKKLSTFLTNERGRTNFMTFPTLFQFQGEGTTCRLFFWPWFPKKPKLERFHQVKVGKLWCWPWKAANDWPLNWSEKIHHFQQPTS